MSKLSQLGYALGNLQSGMAQQLAAQQKLLHEKMWQASRLGDQDQMQRLMSDSAKNNNAASRLEEAQQLLDANMINVDQMKQMLGINSDGSLDVNMTQSNGNQDKVRDGVAVQISKKDLTESPNCPSCHNKHAISHTGEVNVAGHIHDLYSCGSCNSIFTRQQGGLRQFIDKVANAAGVSTGEISLSITDGTGTTTVNNPGNWASNNAVVDWSGLSSQNLNMNNYTLENEARQQTQELRNLKHELLNMTQLMREIIEQNARLQAKMATDPLVGMRDKINQFEIK